MASIYPDNEFSKCCIIKQLLTLKVGKLKEQQSL